MTTPLIQTETSLFYDLPCGKPGFGEADSISTTDALIPKEKNQQEKMKRSKKC